MHLLKAILNWSWEEFIKLASCHVVFSLEPKRSCRRNIGREGSHPAKERI